MVKKAPNPIYKHVGSRVRMRRMMLSMSQEKLGAALSLTFQQVQKYESGGNRISMGRLTRIARLFAVSVPYLLEGDKQAAVLKSSARDNIKYTHALEMLGRIGAQRLLRAFAAIPSKPAGLRESIVRVVEGTTAAAATHRQRMHKRTKRR